MLRRPGTHHRHLPPPAWHIGCTSAGLHAGAAVNGACATLHPFPPTPTHPIHERVGNRTGRKRIIGRAEQASETPPHPPECSSPASTSCQSPLQVGALAPATAAPAPPHHPSLGTSASAHTRVAVTAASAHPPPPAPTSDKWAGWEQLSQKAKKSQKQSRPLHPPPWMLFSSLNFLSNRW